MWRGSCQAYQSCFSVCHLSTQTYCMIEIEETFLAGSEREQLHSDCLRSFCLACANVLDMHLQGTQNLVESICPSDPRKKCTSSAVERCLCEDSSADKETEISISFGE